MLQRWVRGDWREMKEVGSKESEVGRGPWVAKMDVVTAIEIE